MRLGSCLAFAGLILCSPAWSEPAFTFGLIGDLGYSESNAPVAHERELAAVLHDLDSTPLAFVIHDGDLGHPRDVCRDDFRKRRFEQLNALSHPVFYTPGDNEWTDCSPSPDGRMQALMRLRSVFFAGNGSLGRRTLPLERQGTLDAAFGEFAENARWQEGAITFAIIHVVGSSNNLHAAERDRRTAADLAWLDWAFAAARERNSRGLVLVMQANLFDKDSPFTRPIKDALLRAVLAYPAPVVLVHGDTHQFRIDHPLIAPDRTRVVRFTRVETFGTPDHHWVEAIVDYSNPQVFSFQPHYVEENR